MVRPWAPWTLSVINGALRSVGTPVNGKNSGQNRKNAEPPRELPGTSEKSRKTSGIPRGISQEPSGVPSERSLLRDIWLLSESSPEFLGNLIKPRGFPWDLSGTLRGTLRGISYGNSRVFLRDLSENLRVLREKRGKTLGMRGGE